MGKVFIEEESLISIADTIREVGGTTDKLSIPNGFNQAIRDLSGGSQPFAVIVADKVEPILIDFNVNTSILDIDVELILEDKLEESEGE